MYDRRLEFYEPLRNCQIDPDYPVAVGLQPFRKTNVKVEREPMSVYRGRRSTIVHSYGRGGAGFSLSFGCAADVADIFDEIVAEVEADRQVMARM